jgi:hypothetical protein
MQLELYSGLNHSVNTARNGCLGIMQLANVQEKLVLPPQTHHHADKSSASSSDDDDDNDGGDVPVILDDVWTLGNFYS